MKNIISLLFVSVFIFSCSDKKDGKNPLPKIEELSSQDSLLKNQLPDTITGENHSMIMDMILGKPKYQIKSIKNFSRRFKISCGSVIGGLLLGYWIMLGLPGSFPRFGLPGYFSLLIFVVLGNVLGGYFVWLISKQ